MHGDISAEWRRVGRKPVDLPPPALAVFMIEPIGPMGPYVERLEGLISATLEIVKDADFEAEFIGVASLPLWSNYALQGDPHAGREVLHGRGRYFQARQGEDYWDAQEWISCFDPRLRRWRWWDLIQESNGLASLWLDTMGEPVVPLEELWWAIFISGANKGDGPLMLSDTDWRDRRRYSGS